MKSISLKRLLGITLLGCVGMVWVALPNDLTVEGSPDPKRSEVRDSGETALDASLRQRCIRRRSEWLSRLGKPWDAEVFSPYVLVYPARADVPYQQWKECVQRMHGDVRRRFGLPNATAPVSVVCCENEQEFADARRLSFQPSSSNAGFYDPTVRLIVVNVAAGLAPLRHEIAHALLGFAKRPAPLWLDEGIACFFESGVWKRSGNKYQFIATRNWRGGVLTRQPCPQLAHLFHFHTSRRASEASDYARSRQLFRYLQANGVLDEFCRQMLATQRDPMSTIGSLLGKSNHELQEDFESWWRSEGRSAK